MLFTENTSGNLGHFHLSVYLTCSLLSYVLPQHQGAGHMNVERSDESGLRDLDTLVHKLDQFHGDALLLIAQHESGFVRETDLV